MRMLSAIDTWPATALSTSKHFVDRNLCALPIASAQILEFAGKFALVVPAKFVFDVHKSGRPEIAIAQVFHVVFRIQRIALLGSAEVSSPWRFNSSSTKCWAIAQAAAFEGGT